MDTEIACIRLGTVHVIPVTSPEIACRFLKEHDSIFSSRPICMSASLVSNGYLTSAFLPMGEQWIKMRRVLASHVLSPTSFQWLRPKRDEEADHLLRFVYNHQQQCCDLPPRAINLRKLTRYYCANRIQIWKDANYKIVEKDILDVLIMLKDTDGYPLLSVKEIKAQVLELMLATLDNPSNAVEWTMREMFMQPKIMQRAIEEIDTVAGNNNRLVQESDLPHLNYVKACIKEAFRLHPLAVFNAPHVSVSDAIVGEYFIPKGSLVLLSRLGLGRNPRVWEDPSKFKPERHLLGGGEVVLTDSELRLLSFSTG
ncbi:hypothetical protein HAX54_026550 [Datura stramonium]|uniref:Cytochrome P450 n=1 Tax=Datura stramonium TaxID=4076 RepID=A0ABS8V1Y1_DATST|nr:hypothetical protein [Datura stramonium]